MHPATVLGWLFLGLSGASLAAASRKSAKEDNLATQRLVQWQRFCHNVSDGGRDVLEAPLTEEEQEMMEIICAASNATCPERVHCRLHEDEPWNVSDAYEQDEPGVCVALRRVGEWVDMLSGDEEEPGIAEPVVVCMVLNMVVGEWYEVAGDGSRPQEEDEEDEARVGSKWCTDEQAVDEEDGKDSKMSSFPPAEGSDTRSARGVHALYPDIALLAVCHLSMQTSTTSHELAHKDVELIEEGAWAIIVAMVFILVIVVACVLSRVSRHTRKIGSRKDKLGFENDGIFLNI